MGCDQSHVQQLSRQGAPPVLSRQKISDQVKQILIDAIQTDNLAEAAVIAQQNNVQANTQISDEGLFWMASHFCCRWDSPKILQYILKQFYATSPRSYIKFVNSPTSDGYTLLHLCSIWGSQKCFALLNQYGGLDLQFKDKMNKDALQTAKDFKRQKIAKVLGQYRALDLSFTHVQHDKLVSGSILDLDQNNTRKYEMPMSQPIVSLIGRLIIHNEQEQRIRKQKLQIQKNKQELRLKRLKQEQQMRKRKKQLQQEQKLGQAQDLERVFQMDDAKYQNMLDKKYEQINVCNRKIAVVIRRQVQVKMNQENKKIDKQIQKAKQQDLIKRLQDRKLQIQSLQTVVKGALDEKKQRKKRQVSAMKRNQQSIKSRSSMKKQTFGTCPQNLQKLYQQAKQKGIFTDQQFPANNSSIGSSTGKKAAKLQSLTTNLAWYRPNEFFKGGQYQLFDGIDPNDIKQGSLGVCYMLATMSVLAKNPDNIKKMFHFYDKTVGFYVLRLYRDGVQHYVAVDDLIPCSKSMKCPLFTKPIGNQIWVLLLEKAWAKSIGAYLDAQAMTPDHIMQDFSGSPSYGQWLTKNPRQKMQQINMHDDLDHMIVLTSVADKKLEGIANNHAYSMLKSYEHNGNRVYQIRNPWGRFQWKGMYGQNQPIWTEQLKKKVGWKDADDGIFFCSQDQILQCFSYFSVSMIRPSFKYNYMQFNPKKQQNIFLTFQLKHDAQVNLRVTQLFARMIQDANYSYSPVVIELGKIQDDGTVTFISQGHKKCYWGAKSVHATQKILDKYKKGKYFVNIKIFWKQPQKYNKCVVVSYASTDVIFQRISQKQGLKLWAQMLISFAKDKPLKTSGKIQYSMNWMRGQLVLYVKSQNQDQLQAKFKFNLQNLVNTKLGYGAIDDTTIIIPVKRGKPNIGTVWKIDFSKGCTTGSLNISTN